MAEQKLQNIDDIKIPYATEGVIRTAQLDDTVSPENSVQLAVNMNFDRVGAVQTRPGVTEYVPSLSEEIKNYGTLRNSIVEEGYERIYQLGGTASINNNEFRNCVSVKINSQKVAVFWVDGSRGLCQNIYINSGLGVMEPLASPISFNASVTEEPKAIYIGKNGSNQDIVLVTWRDSDGDGQVQCFNVTEDTIVAMSTPLEFDTSNGENFTLAQIDSTHVICFYTSSSDDGYATVFAINLTSGAVTEPGSPTLFESTGNNSNTCIAVGDGTHFINFWSNGSTGRAQCFTVNTGTWAITAESTPLTYDLTNVSFQTAFSPGTGIDFINIYRSSGTGDVTAQGFRLNISTFAITVLGTSTTFGTPALGLSASQLDSNHFMAFYAESAGIGYVQLLEWNTSTFNFSSIGDPLGTFTFTSGENMWGVHYLEDNTAMVVWGNVGTEEGKSAMFRVIGDVVNGRWLYAAHGDEVSNTTGGSWTLRRSGLAQVSKPRFSQFLNYVWMVNGNSLIGGDPIATSNGGNFGTDLIPEGFPSGDFIHAGFEGRVWVANKTLGIIYFTDIVQFTPPTTYSLTYNPEVNFISNLSPQTGQSFTGLYRVPRALLVFTEDTITRIYGATSVDAYPAYNVGTFSQESIIETKTGIFFHHSSGFYQFDYGSQPVEISRRIIDFVKAIPRENYTDVKGVYDGFDVVEWAVGSVTVEGVTFESCVCRYTISTQVWTIYDYQGIDITAMIFYDDGVNLNHLMGTSTGLTGAMDTGTVDFGEEFYYELIDRWRSFTKMYYKEKSISGFNVYSENAAGAQLGYQIQKSTSNDWIPLGTVDSRNNCLFPNASTQDFDVLRLRLKGITRGPVIVVHGIEVTQLQIKGQDQN